MAALEFTDDAIEDLTKLDGSVLPRALKKLVQIESNPESGIPLGRGLTTFRKAVVGNRDWRIIYRIEKDGSVVVVWVIASRTDDECYAEAVKRFEASGQTDTQPLVEAISWLRGSALRKAERIIEG